MNHIMKGQQKESEETREIPLVKPFLESSLINESERNVHGRLKASWKICSLAVNGQSFLVIDGYLLSPQRLDNFAINGNAGKC